MVDVKNLVDEAAPVKRGRGRPKGSKNKPVQAPVAPVQAPAPVAPAVPSMYSKSALAAFERWLVAEGGEMVAENAPAKKRGRPKGSKNKPVQVPVQVPVKPANLDILRKDVIENFIQAEDAPAKKRGRPKGSKNKPVPVQPVQAPAKAQRFRNVNKQGKKQSLKNLIINICARHKTGVKLQELSKLCWESGYRSTSDEKGFVQNIRTNLAALMNNGVIIKDEDKKYHKQEVAG